MPSHDPDLRILNRIANSGRIVVASGARRYSAHSGSMYSIMRPQDFDITKFAKYGNLRKAWDYLRVYGGHGAGIDELTYSDFSEGEVSGDIRNVVQRILQRSYQPQPTRLVRIPKGSGRYRELQLQTLVDRTVSKALDSCLKGFWRSRLPRLGQDVHRMYAALYRAIRQHRAYVLAIDDIRNCFPSTPIAPVIDLHRLYIPQPDLIWLVGQIIQCQDGTGIGLLQGSPYSPVAMELFLHYYFDLQMELLVRRFPLLLRYVDNIAYLCRNVREGLVCDSPVLVDSGGILKIRLGGHYVKQIKTQASHIY